MAKRFTDSEKWKKPFIRRMKAPYKLLWLYILDECDHAGIWQVDFEVAQIKIGERLDRQKAIEQLNGKIHVFNEGEKWFVPEFIEFQYGNLKEENRAHKSVLDILSKNNLIEILKKNKPLISHLEGAKDKDMDKEKEKEEEKESDSEKLKKEIVSQLSNNGRTPEQIEQVATERVAEFEREFQTLTTWINTNTPRVAQMKEPFTLGQFVHLRHKIPDKNKIKDLLLSMHNWKDLHSKNVSAYLTILKWSKREN